MPEDNNENLRWPDEEKLDYCGYKVMKRECGPSKPVREGFSVKIAFGVKGPPPGYFLDTGEKMKEQNGFKYGWTMDNSKNMRIRQDGEGLENQLVLFSPDPNSKFCNDPSLGVTCEDNIWSIKAPRGMYNVKLIMGDKKFNSQYDLSVNGVTFTKGKMLAKDQFLSEEKIVMVNSAKPYIKIGTKCAADNCDYSWSRASAIEIDKIEEGPKEAVGEAEPSGCGVAFEGGNCNRTGKSLENCLYKKTDPFASMCSGKL